MSAGTTTTVLRGLQPDTLYNVSLVPVYADGDGKTMSENGKTSKDTNVCSENLCRTNRGLVGGSACVGGHVQGRWEE